VNLKEFVSGPRPLWMRDALCREYADVTWFPTSGLCGDSDAPESVCSRCLVRSECLAYALENRIDYGIWGGMTAPGRRRVLAERDGRPLWRRPGRTHAVHGTDARG